MTKLLDHDKVYKWSKAAPFFMNKIQYMEAQKDKFEMSIKSLMPRFNEHLIMENNNRILFSAKFGIGKTHFLKKFFESNGGYEVFHLFPVNYQMAANKDIVGLIKLGLLEKLLGKGFVDNKEIVTRKDWLISMEVYMKMVLMRKGISVLSDAVQFLPSLTIREKILARAIIMIMSLLKKHSTWVDSVNDGDVKRHIEKLKEIMTKKSLLETDEISEAIDQRISEIKEGRKSILIIDDLDRMEPEHVFRLLNVLSAYSDKDDGNRNKFGFDKIILVADIDNLRSAYKQKYGENVDFEGYMDKFYSIEVYEYKFEEMIKLRIKEILSKYIVQEGNENRKDAIIRADGYITLILAMIINRSLDLEGEKKTNTRAVIKGMYNDLGVFKERQPSLDMNDEIYYIDLVVHLGIKIFGGEKRRMISILKGIRDDVKIKNVDRDDLIRIYEIFSFGLLEEVYSGKISDGTLGLDWEGYHISLKKKRIESIVHSPYKDVNQNVKRAKFFLDLLIQYIEDK